MTRRTYVERRRRKRNGGYTHDGRVVAVLFVVAFLAAIYGVVSFMASVTKNADAHMARSLERE